MQQPVFDITRMLRRRDRLSASGIDRVDHAYFDFVERQGGLYAAKLGGKMRYFSAEGAKAALRVPARTGNTFLHRLMEGRDLLRHTVARPATPLTYLNTSHFDPGSAAWSQMKARGDRVVILIHDILPLTHPDMFRRETLAPFARFAQNAARNADLVVTSSQHTAAIWKTSFPYAPEAVAIPLGVSPLTASEIKRPDQPYFVCVGTIEPRKNHEFLLDLWDALGPNAPLLHVIGRAGWASEEIFDRLEHAERIIWHQDMDDRQMAETVGGASALLFPSHAEGYGYPPIEAATLGTPTISAPLPSLREALGAAIHQIRLDTAVWASEIEKICRLDRATRHRAVFLNYEAPKWDNHFHKVQHHLQHFPQKGLNPNAYADQSRLGG